MPACLFFYPPSCKSTEVFRIWSVERRRAMKKHGHRYYLGNKKSPTYQSWWNMLKACDYVALHMMGFKSAHTEIESFDQTLLRQVMRRQDDCLNNFDGILADRRWVIVWNLTDGLLREKPAGNFLKNTTRDSGWAFSASADIFIHHMLRGNLCSCGSEKDPRNFGLTQAWR